MLVRAAVLEAYWRPMADHAPHEALILADFLDHYWSDRADGHAHGLEHYLALFPGNADLIRTEFARLERGEESTDGGASPGAASAGLERIGNYRLLEVIGRGGQATVWLAEDERVRRNVALKILRGDPLAAPTLLARFRREAALAAKIDHPAICPMIDLGLDDRPWIAMRHVPGRTLAEILAEARAKAGAERSAAIELPLTDADDADTAGTGAARTRSATSRPIDRQRTVLRLIEKVARAIHVAHEVGIVHRDLKPNNIMVQPNGEPVVLDFGVALDESDDHPGFTHTGDVVGTPAYVAPEQIRAGGRGIDRRADVHALGVILFECLTLERPYSGASREALFHAILDEPPPRLREVDSGFSDDLSVVVEMALQKDPDHRYADALALADDLRRVIENRPILARPIGPITRGRRWAQRNPALALALATILVLLVGGLLSALSLLHETRGALDREAGALRERNAAYDEVLRQKEGVFRLRASADLADLEREAVQDLGPVAAATAAELDARLRAIDDWLVRARDLVAGLDARDPRSDAPSHREQLAILRSRALPRTPEEVERDRATHPRRAELEALRSRRAAEDRGRRVRDGLLPLELPEPGEVEQPANKVEHLKLIGRLVGDERTIFGREAEGLVLTRLLEEREGDSPDAFGHCLIRMARAWSLLANGQDPTEARASLDEMVAGLPPAYRARQMEVLARLDREIERRRGPAWELLVADLDRNIRALETETDERRSYRFAAPDDQWWHDQLTAFIAELERFAGPDGPIAGDSPVTGWSVRHRREALIALRDRFRLESQARSWRECLDRLGQDPRFAGVAPTARPDLVPIGPDPRSGLEEFWQPTSGDRPARDPGTGALELGESTGLVFVLLPGGRYLKGAQSEVPDAPGFDSHAGPQEGPVTEEVVAPLYFSKYEIDQGQYLRLAVENPSMHGPGRKAEGDRRGIDLTNPAENVSWARAAEICRRFGMELPDESEWEYACRAGGTTPWWTGADPRALAGAANVADLAARRTGTNWPGIVDGARLGIDDGQTFHGRVGSYAGNAFGLHDLLGNVAEWCGGEILVQGDRGVAVYRPSRGGSFMASPFQARASSRSAASEISSFDTIGFRPIIRLR